MAVRTQASAVINEVKKQEQRLKKALDKAAQEVGTNMPEGCLDLRPQSVRACMRMHPQPAQQGTRRWLLDDA
jgi:hypothetical protein